MIENKKYTCFTLKMSQFINCLLGEETLPEWEDIYSEYVGLRENKSTHFILDMVKDITWLQTKQYLINKIIPVLAIEYSRELVNELKLLGCRGKFDWSNKEQYSNDLRAAATYAKTFNNKIKRKEKELDEYTNRYGATSVQRKDFEVWAVTFMEHFKVHIDFEIITVARWCVMINEYEKFCEVKNAEHNNLLNKKNGRR